MIVNGTVNLTAPDLTVVTLRAGDEVPEWAVVGAHLIADGKPSKREIPEPDGDGSYAGLKRAELVALCKERGLDGSGKVAELIARLVADDEAAGAGSEDVFDPWAADSETLREVAAKNDISVDEDMSDDEIAAVLEDILGG